MCSVGDVVVCCWTLKKNSFQKNSCVLSHVYIRSFYIYSLWYPEFANVILYATLSLKVGSPLIY